MKTSEAIQAFGSVKAIAAALGISVQAVYLWGETVPKLRQYQLRELIGTLSASPQAPQERQVQLAGSSR